MSTGTTGSLGAPSSGFTGTQSGRTWSGADGKYEVSSGSKRLRWNSYTSRSARLRSFTANFTYRCPVTGQTLNEATPFSFYNNEVTGAPSTVFSGAERNAALNAMLGKVKGHGFNAAVNIAQAHQVADMVVSNLGTLGRAMMALKHGDFAAAARSLRTSRSRSSSTGSQFTTAAGETFTRVGGRRVLEVIPKSRLVPNDVSGRWLELQYGWLPLLSDTFEACKAFEALGNGPQTNRFSTGRSKSVTQTVSGGAAYAQCKLAQKRVLRYTFEQSEELSFERQIGLTDPLSVAWEVIPYSFVVDWFVPIGTYLSNLNQIPHLVGRWMVTESIVTAGCDFSNVPGQPLPWCPFHNFNHRMLALGKPSAQYSGLVVSRSALAGPPTVPPPSVKLIGAVHGNRVWNAIALAAQRFI
jgi:hypothetical protein